MPDPEPMVATTKIWTYFDTHDPTGRKATCPRCATPFEAASAATFVCLVDLMTNIIMPT